ncbi:MAG: HD domain-containing protein [Lachnospiraceae bacterium]|nr:HD domain-containing protein [Lachnospiraceae bacterium]
MNVVLANLFYQLRLPFFMDTAGTICVSLLLGPFYGVLTAVISCAVSTIFNPYAFFFSFVYSLVAIFAARFSKKNCFADIGKLFMPVLAFSALAGILCPVIGWIISEDLQFSLITETATAIRTNTEIPYNLLYLIVSVLMNILDKTVTCLLVVLIMRIVPERTREWFSASRWLQNPLNRNIAGPEADDDKEIRFSVNFRTTGMVVVTSLTIVIAVCWVSIRMYFSNEKEDRIQEAVGAAELAADNLDPESIDLYLAEGRNASGYEQASAKFRRVWENYRNVAYLYVVSAGDGVFRCVLDIEGDEGAPEPYEPGQVLPLEDGMRDYLSALAAGEETEPFETRDSWGWLITVASVVRDEDGTARAFVIADVSVDDLTDYLREFIIKAVLFVAGIIVLVMSLELWGSEVYITYPISDLVRCIDSFANDGDDQDALDEKVRRIRSLDIRTEDEVEKLYHAICNMTLDQAEQMRNIRRLSESTAAMQDGLIITMADLVESRDSDTGEHVQKTAAYVKVIVEALRRKGYYAEKITPKFISDVVRSAPLHDVGKINIPDDILNLPRKLTDEEFEVIKTHTTAGKAIIEKAITTVQGGNYLKEARNMAAYHHERWDGKGYPEGLHGEVIPLSARIMAVADVFDALTSPRVYKPAFPLEKALEMITEGSGSQFDPKCVEAFMDSLPEVRVILNKYSGNAV